MDEKTQGIGNVPNRFIARAIFVSEMIDSRVSVIDLEELLFDNLGLPIPG